MLSGSKLGALGSSKVKLILLLCLAGSIPAIAVYSYQAQQIDQLSLQLADKAKTVEDQDLQILQLSSNVALQQQELDSKQAMLESMNLQIAVLQDEIEANEEAIADKTAEAARLSSTVETQTAVMQSMQVRAAQLQDEIDALRLELAENQAKIAGLSQQVQQTREQLESAKRIKISHYGLGVTESGEGVVFPIEVEVIGSGDGTISVDVKNVQYEASFQEAVRTAAKVASEYTDVSVSDKDIIIRFVNEKSGLIRVDGGSAGALITAMVIAGLDEREINSSVLITGTIRSDGTVGVIGGLEDKAEAAADFGAETILVPEEQEFAHSSIDVVGVSDIDEVMFYLTY